MKYAIVVVGVAGLISLAGCGTSAPSGSPSATESSATSDQSPTPVQDSHNQADVTFATEMIPHHRQAVAMADMALSKAADARVTRIARDVKNAQDPEITKMSSWLTEWGKPAPTASSMTMEGMDHAAGMMSSTDMAGLGKASGKAFDRRWVQLMIKHHQGAVVSARTERTKGSYAAATALAQSIITSQTTEIGQLERLSMALSG